MVHYCNEILFLLILSEFIQGKSYKIVSISCILQFTTDTEKIEESYVSTNQQYFFIKKEFSVFVENHRSRIDKFPYHLRKIVGFI